MRRGRSPFLVSIICLVIASSGAQACSLLLDDDLAGTPTKSEDAGNQSDVPSSPTDGGGGATDTSSSPSNDASDAASNDDDGGPNILINPGFEQGGACTGWLSEFGTITDSDLARNGSHGCLVCTLFAGQEVQLYQIVKRATVIDEAFNGEVWIRSDTRAAPPPLSPNTMLEVDFRSDAGGIDLGAATVPTKPITADWQSITSAATSGAPAESVQLFLHFSSPDVARVCVVVDSTRLYKTN
jgi:hypothetical protein